MIDISSQALIHCTLTFTLWVYTCRRMLDRQDACQPVSLAIILLFTIENSEFIYFYTSLSFSPPPPPPPSLSPSFVHLLPPHTLIFSLQGTGDDICEFKLEVHGKLNTTIINRSYRNGRLLSVYTIVEPSLVVGPIILSSIARCPYLRGCLKCISILGLVLF